MFFDFKAFLTLWIGIFLTFYFFNYLSNNFLIEFSA